MRKTCVDMVHTLAKSDERVVFIGSDLSPGLLGEMKQEFPERHYMEGISEANFVGMAAGMAMDTPQARTSSRCRPGRTHCYTSSSPGRRR